MVGKRIVDVLNELLEDDERAIIAFLSMLIPTNKIALEKYDIKVSSNRKYAVIGILSVFNKIIEVDGERIEVEYESSDFEFKIRKFKLVKR